MIKQYLLAPCRRLWKNRSTTVINLAGLSIGMAAAILIMLWVQNESSYDSYHTDAKRIFRITNYSKVSSGEGNTWVSENTPFIYGTEAQRKIPGIEAVARLSDASYNAFIFNLNGELFKEKKCAYADSNWFNLFHYNIIAGSLTAFSNSNSSIVITASKAVKYFGKTNPIGQIIKVDSNAYTIQAVLEDNPSNSSFQYDIFFPIGAYYALQQNKGSLNYWGASTTMTFLKLKTEVIKADIESKLTALFRENIKKFSKTDTWSTLVPLTSIRFESAIKNSPIKRIDQKSVTIFSILAFLLLFIACINYVNLTTARASLRAKEISIRKISGASKWQLFKQVLSESFFISIIAMIITLVIVQFCLPYFNNLMETRIALSLSNVQLWEVIIGALVFTTLLNGIYPALLLSSFSPLDVFRGMTILKVKDVHFRKTLVVVQSSIAAILITGTIVIFLQMRFIQKTNIVYNKAQIMKVTIPSSVFPHRTMKEEIVMRLKDNGFIENIKNDLKKEASIESVSIAHTDIINNTSKSSGGYDWEGKPANFDPSITGLSADADFPEMFHLTLIAGRWFRNHDKADEAGFVLNETALKELGIHQPAIGLRFVHDDDTGTVIGVVKDFNFQSMHEKIGPLVIYNQPYWRRNIYIRVAPGQSANAIQATEAKWKALFPAIPFEFQFLDESFDQLYRSDRKSASLIFIFSLISIGICAMGLWGLITFSAERRVKEIGVRKVLGASVTEIVALLSKEFVFLSLLSIAIALPTAWILMNKWLQDFAYRINISLWIVLAAAFISISITIITVSMQAIKAAIANPAKSLRTE